MADITTTKSQGPLTTLAQIGAAKQTGDFRRVDLVDVGVPQQPSGFIHNDHGEIDTIQVNKVLAGVQEKERRGMLTGDFIHAQLLVRDVFERHGGQGVEIKRAVFDSLLDAVCDRRKRWFREDAVDLRKVRTIPHEAITSALAELLNQGQRRIPCSEFLDVCARAYFEKADRENDTTAGGAGSSGSGNPFGEVNDLASKGYSVSSPFYRMRGRVDQTLAPQGPLGVGALWAFRPAFAGVGKMPF